MSMRTYPMYQVGLVFDCDMAEALSEKNIDFKDVSCFEGNVCTVEEFEYENEIEWTYDDDTLFYIPLNQPSLFDTAYPNKEAMIEDAKNKIKDILEDFPDFDVTAHVCWIVGTTFG